MKKYLVGRMRFCLVGAAVFAAVVATGASGVSSSGTITTIAGNGKPGFSGDGGPAIAAQLHAPEGVAVDGVGNVYIADAGNNNRVRKVTPGGTITTIAGGGLAPGPGWGDGGRATSAQLRGPNWVAVDGQGNVYISDFFNSRVRKVNTAGTITTFAGTGITGYSGDGGPATSAGLVGPQGVAVDGQGNVYIVDGNGDRVRKVDRAGTITTFAGTGLRGFSGDGGPATSARLNNPEGVAVDQDGNVYIADLQNGRVRKVNPVGTITTFAGGGPSLGDGGRATSALVRYPYGVAVDGQGNVYIADRVDHRVRVVNKQGTITTFAGTGSGGFTGDGGAATHAQVFAPFGVAADGKGNIYIGDTQNYRVRKVTVGASTAPSPVTGTPSGTVLVNGKPYTGGAIPYGSKVDVTKGKVTLNADVGTLTASGSGGITAAFTLLRFKVGGKAIVELRLTGGKFGVCTKRRASSRLGVGATPPPKTVRRLWARGTGSFRTRGKYATGMVRGTNWLTADRCDGTYVKTRQGVVAVVDLVLKKTVLVKAGKSYLAKKP